MSQKEKGIQQKCYLRVVLRFSTGGAKFVRKRKREKRKRI